MLSKGNRVQCSASKMGLLFLVNQLWCLQYVHCEFGAISLSGKPTSQSSTHSSSFTSHKAIDGNPSTFSHTNDPNPWWKLDLKTEHCLGRITVQIRSDCCGQNRFLGTVVRSGLSPNHAENRPCGEPATAAQSVAGAVTAFPCRAPRMARYVSLDIDPSRPGVTSPVLQIAEVTVESHGATCDPVIKATIFGRVREKALIGNPDPLSTRTARSLMTCADFCAKETGCLSFDYGKGSRRCRLYSLDSADIAFAPNEEFAVYTAGPSD